MQLISSRSTFVMKRIFPAIWMGGVSAGFLVGLFAVVSKPAAGAWPFVLVPLVMLVFGYFLFGKLVWNLADEVQDAGSYLLVRKGSLEQRVQLGNILNVSVSQFTNPRRLTLRLRRPCEFGDEIAFIPKAPVWQWNPFARNPVAEDLMRRADSARNGVVPA